jgi:hypothetical protein
MRLKVSHFLALVVVTALSIGLMAGPASARTHRMSAKQKAHIRASLRKQVKKNPKIVNRRWFLKKASLVNFKLPITVRLRSGSATSPETGALANNNTANLDLGASLGQRQLALSGEILGYIQFHDSFDGGALGNVDIVLTPGGGGIKTTSLPLLWNPQVADPATHWYDAGFSDLNPPPAGSGNPLNYTANPGCGDFTNASTVPSSGTATSTFGNTLQIPAGTLADPTATPDNGVPFFTSLAAAQAHTPIAGHVEEYPGVDDITNIVSGNNPNNINDIGPNPDPFPAGAPYEPFAGAQSGRNSVLRTAPITLGVTPSGTPVNESTNGDGTGAQSGQNLVVGQSGGQANLFGNIPGKGYGIDVTVSLDGQINSILRSVDPDVHPLFFTQAYPAAAFDCRQAFTGAVHNYIPGLNLKGSLHISPAITNDGHLRIAKATLDSLQPTHVALAACLMPYSTFAMGANSNAGATVPSDALASSGGSMLTNPVPSNVTCNTTPLGNVVQSATPNVASLQQFGLSSADGSQVSVSGDISTHISADVLIGQGF